MLVVRSMPMRWLFTVAMISARITDHEFAVSGIYDKRLTRQLVGILVVQDQIELVVGHEGKPSNLDRFTADPCGQGPRMG